MLIRSCAALLALLLVSATATARPFTAKDLVMMERVSDPNLSPDSRYIALTLRSTDWDANKGIFALQLIDRTSPDTPPITLAEKENAPTNPRWSRDGKWIYFLSSASGSRQVWRMSPDGQSRMQMTALPLSIAFFRLSPDERSLVVAIDARPECATLACTKAAEGAKAKSKASGKLFNGQVRFFNSYEDEYFTGLFFVSIAEGGAPNEAIPLLKNFRANVVEEGDFAIAQDGRTVYFSSTTPDVPQGIDSGARLYQVPTDGTAAPSRLLSQSDTHDIQPVISPDGTKLAWLAGPYKNAVSLYAHNKVMILDFKSGRIQQIGSEIEAQIIKIKWTADGSEILLTIPEKGQTPLLAIDVAKGTVRTIAGEGKVSDFDGTGTVISYVKEGQTTPPQIFDVAANAAPRQLSHVNKSLLAEVPMAPAEQFSFAGWNGEKVYGYIVKPQNFVEGKKYPIVFRVHGGPQDTFGNLWSYSWNPQVWAGMGFATVIIDFHGSTGYGQSFANSVLGHWADRPLVDLKKGWAYLLSRYSWLDGNNACALGGSYGGYMINWIAGQWNDPFKCLISHASIFDMRSLAFSMDIPNYAFSNPGPGFPMNTPRFAEHQNPASHADKWKKPILVTHGGIDYRVPTDQGIAAYTAALWFKVPTQLLLFPDESHGIVKPQNSLMWYETVEAWMKRWMGK